MMMIMMSLCLTKSLIMWELTFLRTERIIKIVIYLKLDFQNVSNDKLSQTILLVFGNLIPFKN